MKSKILKTLLVCCVFFLIVKGSVYYCSADAHHFCDTLANDFNEQNVLALAKEFGYDTQKFEGGDELVVSTQKSPFFRFGCVVYLKNGVVYNKVVMALD